MVIWFDETVKACALGLYLIAGQLCPLAKMLQSLVGSCRG